MCQPKRHPQWIGTVAGVYFALSICLCAASPQVRAAADLPVPISSVDHDRVCNPPPGATPEDMKLALTLLRDTTQIPNWANIAWYVGESGSPEYFEPLKEFVLGGHAPIDPGTWFGAITSAQLGIGIIAASSPQALRYLSQSTNPTFWKTFPQDVRLAMSETSIEALGNSGASEARQILLRLRQWPYRESQRDAIEKAIRECGRRATERKYYGLPSRFYSNHHLLEIIASRTDSISLLGSWRWIRTMNLSYITPPDCGWSRTLIFARDSTYSFWEQDSAHVYRVCGGKFILHSSEGNPKQSWVELRDWSWQDPGTFWLRRAGPDLLELSAGEARGPWTSELGLTHTFLKETNPVALDQVTDIRNWRPPRVLRTADRYYIEMPKPMKALLYESESFMPWDLRYTRNPNHQGFLVPRTYAYTHYQIPSGVIGDFDGDSLADAAVYGYDGTNRSAIVCILSNHGLPHKVVAWLEPLRSKRKEQQLSRPLLYLERCTSGQSFLDSSGTPSVLGSDGFCTTWADGERSIFYYANGDFHRGSPAVAKGGK